MNTIEQTLKLLALRALPEIERRGLDYQAAVGQKQRAKREYAIEHVMAGVQGVYEGRVDCHALRPQVEAAVDWAFGEIGGALNSLSRAEATEAAPLLIPDSVPRRPL